MNNERIAMKYQLSLTNNDLMNQGKGYADEQNWGISILHKITSGWLQTRAKI